MIKINFLGPIKYKSINLEIRSLEDLSIELKKIAYIDDWLKDSTIAVNDKIISDIKTKLNDGDIISILPPVSGG